jgi:alpha,alpha-trehalase
VNIAKLYADSKTFVDKPTVKPPKNVSQDFAAFNGSTPTYNQVLNFVDTDFKGEGLELEPQALDGFDANPAFLNNVSDPLVKGFAGAVHGYWNQLIRGTNDSVLCADGSCESTLIPLNHTFVVPGGRFREQCACETKHAVSIILTRFSLRLLGQFLDRRRFDTVPIVRYCEIHARELYG